MENITSATELKNAIQRLEVEQAIQGQQLKEHFYLAYESIKPVNLLRNTLHEVTSSPYLLDSILGTAVGLATGYLSRLAVVGASGNLIKKLFGSVLQLGVTNTVAQHPGAIKSIGQYIFQHILRKKEKALPGIL
jgi:hypothetical protein